MAKKSSKKKSSSHALAGAKSRFGFGAGAGHASHGPKHLGRPAIKKAVKAAVKDAVKVVVKDIKPIAEAAKRIADHCATQLKHRDVKIHALEATVKRAEQAIALGNIGRGLRSTVHSSRAVKSLRMAHGRERARMKKEAVKAIQTVQKRAEQAFMLGNIGRGLRATVHGHPAHRHGPKHGPKHAPVHHLHTPHHAPAKPQAARHSKPHAKPHHAKPHHAEPHHKLHGHKPDGVTANEILHGAPKGKGSGKSIKVKKWNFWQCAGPVRSGCGHSGSFVVGDTEQRKGIRLRGQQPYQTRGQR